MHKSTVSAPRKPEASESKKTEWKKPYKDFPLSFHPPSRRLYKKIRGRRYYFGYSDDWQAALDAYLEQKDDLHAGRKPRKRGDGCTVKDLCNHFLTAKRHQLDCGELSPRSWHDYKSTTDRIIRMFGKSRRVEDLAADDFTELRADIAETRGPVALGTEVNRVRVVFKYAYDAALIAKPVRFGPTFKPPKKAVLRRSRQANGSKMFEASELLTLLEKADTQLKAMILLAVNCGFGNNDVSRLPIDAIDLEGGWLDFPRPKTAIERRCPLWPETVAALREHLSQRTEPKEDDAEGMVFVTKYGQPWAKVGDAEKARTASPLSAEFRKLLKACDLYRKGRGFYALRHVFETIGGESRDQVAVNAIMGHVDDSMAANYRQRISDARLRAVVDVIHAWLWSTNEEKTESTD